MFIWERCNTVSLSFESVSRIAPGPHMVGVSHLGVSNSVLYDCDSEAGHMPL